MYLPFVDMRVELDFTGLNEESYVQFISQWFEVTREFEEDKRYYIRMQIAPSIGIAADHPLVDRLPDIEDPDDPNYGIPQYIFDDPYKVVENDLRILMVISDDRRDICFTELIPHRYDTETGSGMF